MPTPPEALASVNDIDCRGRTALVTGSTNGIGRAAALALGRLGADVVVHGRDPAAGAEVMSTLSDLGARATFVEADFTDPDAVRRLADTARSWADGLDLLLNNAGGLFQEKRLVGPGVELTFHVNHLAPYLLTAHLLDSLQENARVVTTASEAHRGATLALDRLADGGGRAGMGAYSHSKLANILFARELGRRLQEAGRSVVSHSVHPGFVPGSQFGRFLPGPLTGLFRLLGVVPGTSSVADGAAALLHAALAPAAADAPSRYFSGRQPTAPADAARDPEAARRLWRYSADVLGINEPLAHASTAPRPERD
jgi:NAD(P)-dependent dehydrogenase (short-subunit alcohol dehydrogenase family)